MRELAIQGFLLSAKEVWDIARMIYGDQVKLVVGRDEDAGHFASGSYLGNLILEISSASEDGITHWDLLTECGEFIRANIDASLLPPKNIIPSLTVDSLAQFENQDLPYDDDLPACVLYTREEKIKELPFSISIEKFFSELDTPHG